jgi:hypothetical protein
MSKQDLMFLLACFEATRKNGGIGADAFLLAHNAHTNAANLLAQMEEGAQLVVMNPARKVDLAEEVLGELYAETLTEEQPKKKK